VEWTVDKNFKLIRCWIGSQLGSEFRAKRVWYDYDNYWIKNEIKCTLRWQTIIMSCLRCNAGSRMPSLTVAGVLLVIVATVASIIDAQLTCYSCTTQYNEIDCDPPTPATPTCTGATCVTYTLPYGSIIFFIIILYRSISRAFGEFAVVCLMVLSLVE